MRSDGSHAAWLQATYINTDSNFIAAKAGAEANELAVRFATGAQRIAGRDILGIDSRDDSFLRRGVMSCYRPAPDDAVVCDEAAGS